MNENADKPAQIADTDLEQVTGAGGVFVAAADVNGDGASGRGTTVVTGGTTVAVGDLNGDGNARGRSKTATFGVGTPIA